jgi:hypothetical protein
MADEIKIPIDYIEQVSRRRDPTLIDRAKRARLREEGDDWCFTPKTWKQVLRGSDPMPTPMPSRKRQALNVIGAVSHATKSIAKTTLGFDRASDVLVHARLAICRQCPGDHAVIRNGELHTCGPMLDSIRKAGEGTCGCILEKKARDLSEDCPFGWWPRTSLPTDGPTA